MWRSECRFSGVRRDHGYGVGSTCKFSVSCAMASDVGYGGKTFTVASDGGSECKFSGGVAAEASDCGRECRVSGDVAAVASDAGSECRFSGVRRDHGCGVANANLPFLV